MNAHAKLNATSTVICLAAVALIGFSGAIYGPTLSAIADELGISAPIASLVVSAHGAGAFAAVALSLHHNIGKLMRYRPPVALALISIGAFGIASGAPVPFPFVGAFLIGFGYGLITVGLNSLFARSFGEYSDAMVNLLNTMFGIGAIAAPAAFIMFNSAVAATYFSLAILALVLSLPAILVDDRKPPEKSSDKSSTQFPTLPLLLMFGTIGVEATVIGWGPTILIEGNETRLDAARAASWFFVVYLATRTLAIPLSLYVTCQVIFLGAIIGLTFVAVGAWTSESPRVWFITFGIVGLVFPNGFGWFAGALSDRPGIEAQVILAALLGATIVPLFMSWWANQFGAASLFFPITLLLAAMTVMALRVTFEQSTN